MVSHGEAQRERLGGFAVHLLSPDSFLQFLGTSSCTNSSSRPNANRVTCKQGQIEKQKSPTRI
jgi:hypothetical protein